MIGGTLVCERQDKGGEAAHLAMCFDTAGGIMLR